MPYLLVLLSFLLSCSAPPQNLTHARGTVQSGEQEPGKVEPTAPTSDPQVPETNSSPALPAPHTTPVPSAPQMTPSAPETLPMPGDKNAAVPTAGCGKMPNQNLAQYVRTNVTGMERVYDLYLPKAYDSKKPYRLVVLGHGCGGGVPFKMESVSKDEAIIVGLKSTGNCFIYDMKVEGPYFDQVIKDVSQNLCVDSKRIFMGGFSSGSWLSNLLGCARADVIRAQGNAAGGLPGLPTCNGPIAAMMVHDMNDQENKIEGGIKARDRILKMNSCSQETEPYAYDGNAANASKCVKYKGCKEGYPVVWCQTTGKGHSSNEPLTNVGLWKFWSEL